MGWKIGYQAVLWMILAGEGKHAELIWKLVKVDKLGLPGLCMFWNLVDLKYGVLN
jgi:hypothetical protein